MIAYRTVKDKCPPETATPSLSWFLKQFIPKHPRYRSAFTGKLKVRRMVQSRQLRQKHQDAHYASAMFRCVYTIHEGSCKQINLCSYIDLIFGVIFFCICRDLLYALLIHRYMKEFAIKHRENVDFYSCDDKCKISIGEPGLPIAAVDRGRKVSLNHKNISFMR